MTEQKERYFQYPLFLIRDLLKDKKKCFDNILGYGIYHYAENMTIDEQNMFRQTIYNLYNNRLPGAIQNRLNNYIQAKQLKVDYGYRGFGCAGYDPEPETEDLTKILKDDFDLFDDIEQWYRIRQTYEFYGLEGDILSGYNKGKQIARNIPDKEPMPMINTKHLFDYRDNEKTVFELEVFAVVCGMNSILGKKEFVKTTRDLVLARAYGYATMKSLQTNARAAKVFDKRWGKDKKETYRYRTEKVFDDIVLGNWNLSKYKSPDNRGFYITRKLITYNDTNNKKQTKTFTPLEMTKKIAEKDKKQKLAKLKREQDDAYRIVYNKPINNTGHNTGHNTITTP